MVERALGEPPVAVASDWRDILSDWVHRLLEGYSRHPWTLAATVGPRPVGPREAGWTESGLAALARTPLTRAERLDALVLLAGHARMLAEQAAARPEAQLNAAFAEVVGEHADRYPELAAALAESTADSQDQAFGFGLARILDGLEWVINRRSGRD